jgi:hypothetical protein
MADKSVWTGASATTYTYEVHPLPVTFSPNQCGNYIYAKIVDNAWCPIYIGEGDLRDRISVNHHQAENIAKKLATHVHVHLNATEDARTSEEADLLANYSQAYAPNGCNEKIGG